MFGIVLAREYADPECWAVHALTVDTYAVQHPGRPTPRAVRSVCSHLLSLCHALEGGTASGPEVMRRALRTSDRFRWLEPPTGMLLTVVDVVPATEPAAHVRLVRAWAESAWDAWAPHHDTVRSWLAGE
jgi:hypothetical protein